MHCEVTHTCMSKQIAKQSVYYSKLVFQGTKCWLRQWHLAPELSFDYSRILDFAEMRTVLQSNKHKEKLTTSSKCTLHVYLLPFWTLWRFRFFACFLLQLKGTKQPHIIRFTTPQNLDFKKLLKGDIITLLWSCSCFSFVSFFKQLLHIPLLICKQSVITVNFSWW